MENLKNYKVSDLQGLIGEKFYKLDTHKGAEEYEIKNIKITKDDITTHYYGPYGMEREVDINNIYLDKNEAIKDWNENHKKQILKEIEEKQKYLLNLD